MRTMVSFLSDKIDDSNFMIVGLNNMIEEDLDRM